MSVARFNLGEAATSDAKMGEIYIERNILCGKGENVLDPDTTRTWLVSPTRRMRAQGEKKRNTKVKRGGPKGKRME